MLKLVTGIGIGFAWFTTWLMLFCGFIFLFSIFRDTNIMSVFNEGITNYLQTYESKTLANVTLNVHKIYFNKLSL